MRILFNKITKGADNILAEEFYKNIEKNKSKTFDCLYSRNVMFNYKNYVIKTDWKSLVWINTAYILGYQVDLSKSLCSEMMPISLPLPEINDLLKSWDKAVL